jgi:hypothetical protein
MEGKPLGVLQSIQPQTSPPGPTIIDVKVPLSVVVIIKSDVIFANSDSVVA